MELKQKKMSALEICRKICYSFVVALGNNLRQKWRQKMYGVTVNALAVLAGTLCGLLFKRILNEEVKKVIMQAMGISVIGVGMIDMLNVSGNITMILVLILSMAVGSAVGALLRIQYWLERLGEFLQKSLSKKENSTLGEAFTSSVLIFCIGAMVVYGSINAGLGDNSTLYIKSILDGCMAMILASSLGIGVALSAIVVFLLQSVFALSAGMLNPILVAYPEVKTMLSGIGGTLVMCIGINILEIKKIRTGDMIPAILGCIAMIFLG